MTPSFLILLHLIREAGRGEGSLECQLSKSHMPG